MKKRFSTTFEGIRMEFQSVFSELFEAVGGFSND